jgi:uncharacterized caspase-like protein
MIPSKSVRRALIACGALVLGAVPLVSGIHAAAKVFEASRIGAGLSTQAPRNRIALIIGNVDYPDANAPLSRDGETTTSLAASLRARGFDVDLEENLTKARMDGAVSSFLGKIKPGATALVAFTGYGIQVERKNYLIPTDAHIWTETQVARDGLSIDTLLAGMKDKGADVTIAILDASRRNPFERRFRAGSDGLASIDAPSNALVLSSMSPGKVTSDTDPLAGRVIGVLVDEIKRGAGDIESVFDRTRRRVCAESKGAQVPFVSSSMTAAVDF